MTKLLGERAWLLARIGDEAGLRRVRGAPGRRAGLLGRRHARAALASNACLEAAFDAAGLRAAAQALARGGKHDVSARRR